MNFSKYLTIKRQAKNIELLHRRNLKSVVYCYKLNKGSPNFCVRGIQEAPAFLIPKHIIMYYRILATTPYGILIMHVYFGVELILAYC